MSGDVQTKPVPIITNSPFMLGLAYGFKNTFLSCQTAPPSMPGPAGMMNVAGQGNQPGYPGQMSSMGQQPAMVSYM